MTNVLVEIISNLKKKERCCTCPCLSHEMRVTMVTQKPSTATSRTIRMQKFTLMLFSLSMMVMIIMLVSGVEDILNSNPKVFLPPSVSRVQFIGGLNLNAIQEIHHNIHKYITNWQAVQIIRPDVPKETITFTNNKKKLETLNQSDAVAHHSKCALIGNAGILYGSGCGDVIDKFNFVIRMNLAPSGGEFEDDVGSKVNLTTLNIEQMERLISCTNSTYPPKWKCESTDDFCIEKRERKYPPPRAPYKCDDLLRKIERLNGTTLWFFKGIRRVYFDAMKRMLGLLESKYNIIVDFAYSPVNPMKPASRAWNLDFPSSGIAIYSAATQFCHQISMFGFYPFSQDSRNRTLRHHYYEKDSKMNYITNVHEMPSEYRIFTELNRTGAIHLVNECTPS